VAIFASRCTTTATTATNAGTQRTEASTRPNAEEPRHAGSRPIEPPCSVAVLRGIPAARRTRDYADSGDDVDFGNTSAARCLFALRRSPTVWSSVAARSPWRATSASRRGCRSSRSPTAWAAHPRRSRPTYMTRRMLTKDLRVAARGKVRELGVTCAPRHRGGKFFPDGPFSVLGLAVQRVR
jgi:hypothetical protein